MRGLVERPLVSKRRVLGVVAIFTRVPFGPVSPKPCRRVLSLDGNRLRRVEQMPTVLRDGPYRLFFYAGDRDEPAHIHVEREDKIAKIWLEPIRLQRSGGFNRAEIGEIQKVVSEHHAELMEAWHGYFNR